MLLKKLYRLLLNKSGSILRAINNQTIDGTKIMGEFSNIKLGTNVSFGGNVLLFAVNTIEIGDHTMIGYGTIIHTATHDYNDHPMWLKRIDMPVRIGKHVWIGFGVKILPGIIIGDYAVIAAGSVVNKHVPAGAIIAGNPAKIIKYRELGEEFLNNPQIDSFKDSLIIKSSFLDSSKTLGKVNK